MRTPFVALAVLVLATPLQAGKIERACNASDRSASRAVCSCIQQVADVALTRADQKLAAKFFADPQLAQDTRQSDNARHESFWERYKAFGSRAAEVCG